MRTQEEALLIGIFFIVENKQYWLLSNKICSMSEQSSSSIQLNDEEIDILENDYDRWRFIFYLSNLFFVFFSALWSVELIKYLFI